MLNALYVLALPICFVVASLFGFLVGRCGRKLPILDSNLPWTMYRGHRPCLPENAEQMPAHTGRPEDRDTWTRMDDRAC